MPSLTEILMTTRKRLLAAAGTIALLLTGAPLTTHGAMAQTGASAPDRAAAQPVSTTVLDKGAATRQFSAANARQQLQFSSYKSLSQLYKHIPEARDLYEQLKKDGEIYLLPAQGGASRVSDTLFILRDDTSGSCGSLGCAYLGFMRQEDGTYTNVLNVSIPGPIELKIVNGEQSLLLCTHEGLFTEWKMQGMEMEPVPLPLDAPRESCATAPGNAPR